MSVDKKQMMEMWEDTAPKKQNAFGASTDTVVDAKQYGSSLDSFDLGGEMPAAAPAAEQRAPASFPVGGNAAANAKPGLFARLFGALRNWFS